MRITSSLSMLFFPLFIHFFAFSQKTRIPIESTQLQNINQIELTEIGEFGLKRKERPQVQSHLHTGIDIRRPGSNYANNPIYPVAAGLVISKRDDGPFAQLIIAHQKGDLTFWTVYEHIAGIVVEPGDVVDPDHAMARFMNTQELNSYGWQFDHFHFEVLKVLPLRLQPNSQTPSRFFNSYTLICYTDEELHERFYHPIHFLAELFVSNNE